MKNKLVSAIFKSGLHEYITANMVNDLLERYYEPLADSIIMFEESLNQESFKKRILWLIQHSSLFIVGQQKLGFIFDGYDLGLMDQFVNIVKGQLQDTK